jgi:hypothetical protein
MDCEGNVMSERKRGFAAMDPARQREIASKRLARLCEKHADLVARHKILVNRYRDLGERVTRLESITYGHSSDCHPDDAPPEYVAEPDPERCT